MKYQVGKPFDLKSSDPWFTTIEAAIEHANQMHHGFKDHPFGRDTVAIWDDRSDYVVLFFDGEMFRKV